MAGNITEIKLGDKKIYEYAYDVHGRITKELDYVNKTGCTYGYTSTGNVVAKHIKEINNDGSLTNVRDIKYSYQNGEWADQLTQYDGQKITYDGMGNPIDYIDGKTFKWTRGRQLEQMTLKDGSSVTYKYNQDGLRTYKDTKESITNYQWDDSKLIRETVAYKGDEKKYDIWYFYNNDDEAIGFEYSEVDNSNIVKTPIYFEKNNCKECTGEINIVHKAIYIDNPFVIDELSKDNELDPMNQMIENLLVTSYREKTIEGIIEAVRAKEKLADLFEMLQNVVEGDIVMDQKDEFYLRTDKYDEPISLHNLSTGMKSFVILKMLIEKGCLKDKDVLILDEPEIHLHPQWQIAYAELIVLLQKQFDLSVVITTHSPYFVDALNLFSCKYGTDKKVNYYLSSNQGNMVTIDNVTDNIDLIYKKMATPIQMLDTLRYELNNN